MYERHCNRGHHATSRSQRRFESNPRATPPRVDPSPWSCSPRWSVLEFRKWWLVSSNWGTGPSVEQRTVNAEREVKLSVPREYRLPDLHQLGLGTVQLPEQTLSTSYFDTEDLRLWQRSITLRYRVGEDHQSGTWTLKWPGKDLPHEVNRVETSWPGSPGAIPAEASALLRGIVRRQILEQVVLLEAKRRHVLVRIGGSALGEIDDDIVTVSSGGRPGRTFRQIEFECDSDTDTVPPDPSAIETLLTAMKSAGAHIDDGQKFAKALGLETHHESRPASDLGPHSTLEAVLQQGLHRETEQLLDLDLRLRLDPENPSERAIHQARVATRRLRSDLKLFSPVLDPVWLRHTRSELKWMGTVLGAIRDIDVLDTRFQSTGATALESLGQDQLRSKLRTRRRENSDELAQALRSDRYLDLLDRLHAGTRFPRFYVSPHADKTRTRAVGPNDAACTALPQLLGTHWRKLRRRVRSTGSPPSDTQLHRIRIASKQLRYGAELAQPVIGKAARRTARRAKDIQTILGNHHDSVAAVEWLEQIPLDGTPEASFVAGSRGADARRQQRKSRQQWTHAWNELARGAATDWLR